MQLVKPEASVPCASHDQWYYYSSPKSEMRKLFTNVQESKLGFCSFEGCCRFSKLFDRV